MGPVEKVTRKIKQQIKALGLSDKLADLYTSGDNLTVEKRHKQILAWRAERKKPDLLKQSEREYKRDMLRVIGEKYRLTTAQANLILLIAQLNTANSSDYAVITKKRQHLTSVKTLTAPIESVTIKTQEQLNREHAALVRTNPANAQNPRSKNHIETRRQLSLDYKNLIDTAIDWLWQALDITSDKNLIELLNRKRHTLLSARDISCNPYNFGDNSGHDDTKPERQP